MATAASQTSQQKPNTETAKNEPKPKDPIIDFAKWSARQLELLELEQEQGLAQHELRKIVVNKLQLGEVKVGAFGKTVLTLERAKPMSAISTGSPVKVYCPRWGSRQESEVMGIVKSCDDYVMEVVCKASKETKSLESSAEFDVQVETVPDETTIKRIRRALEGKNAPTVFGRWERLFFGDASPRFLPESTIEAPKVQALLASLNESQKKAAGLVCRARDVAVIHGPPGTGKTTTVVKAIEAVFQLNPGAKMLCCAPSNVAVDNLVTLLSRKNIPLVRLGHPSRVSPALQAHTLEHFLSSSNASELLQDAKKELAQTKDWSRRRELREEIKQRERDAVSGVIDECSIVLSTIAGASELRKLLRAQSKTKTFTHLVVDEAAQSMESAIFVPLMFLDPSEGVLVLAGDHKQLPPTILSDEASSKGLAFTLMERLAKHKPECSVLLSTQYRMNEHIMRWSSNEMYGGNLNADASVAQRTLKDLPSVKERLSTENDDDLLEPLIFIDTAGCNLAEKDESSTTTESRSNAGEAELVCSHLRTLVSKGLDPLQMCVVTPYRDQVELIRFILSGDALLDKVEVRTVDGFQGQERECVVLSMVRSNPKRIVGFLADERRLNVAVTRAKRQVCMIGDSLTLQSNPFLSRLIKHFEENGSVRSAQEFIRQSDQQAFTEPQRNTDKTNKASKPEPKPVKKTADPERKPKPSSSSSAPKVIKPTSKPLELSSVQEQKVMTGAFKSLVEEEDDEDEEEAIEANVEEPDGLLKESKPSVKANQKKKKKAKKPLKDDENVDGDGDEDEDDDEMAFLEQEAFAATRCASYPECTKSIELIGHTCAFCRRKFCMTHCLAEKHGCGGVARAKAFDERKLGVVRKPALKAVERAKVKEKLQDKIKSQEKDRAAAAKPKKKT